MSFFAKGGGATTPFGRNEFLRSVNPKPQTESYTVARDTVPQTLDANGNVLKILQPGTAMAKITSGHNAGKIGPFQAAGTAEKDTITPSGSWVGTGGTYALGVTGSSDPDDTADLDFDATAAEVAAAVAQFPSYEGFTVTATGGPLGTAAIVVTFAGEEGEDVPNLTFDGTNITGGTDPDATVTQSTASAAGALDGRGDTANLVGLELTFLPWQLLERDVEVSVVTNCTAVQAWCFEYDAADNRVVLSDATAAQMVGKKRLDINFS